MIPPYPLTWPDGLPRTEKKVSSQFRTSLSAAIANVKKSLAAFASDTNKAVTEIAVTSNVAGITFEPPTDTGVAVWFDWEGQQRCIAVDRYPKVEDNLQAIHHILEARRTEMRHGGLHIVRQTFKGFVALPAPEGARPWRDVLGLVGAMGSITPADVKAAYRTKAQEADPDKPGGSKDRMNELTRARDEALAAIQ
jgi:hypothetical protein